MRKKCLIVCLILLLLCNVSAKEASPYAIMVNRAANTVTVYDDAEDPGPLGKPAPLLDEISEEAYNGWDPTDPAPGTI